MALRDELSAVPAATAVEMALCALDGIQGRTRAEQIVGVNFLAYLMNQQLGLDISQMFNQAERRYDDVNTYFKREAQALTDYINGELR